MCYNIQLSNDSTRDQILYGKYCSDEILIFKLFKREIVFTFQQLFSGMVCERSIMMILVDFVDCKVTSSLASTRR